MSTFARLHVRANSRHRQATRRHVLRPSNTRVFKSLTGGDSWVNPYPDLPFVYKTTRFGSVEVAPNNSDKLYVAVPRKGVYIVTPSGISLKNAQHGLANDVITNNGPWPHSLAIDYKNPNTIYAGYWSNLGATNGVFRSLNGGDTWENINGNLGSRISVAGLKVHPLTSQVYLGLWSGIWKLPPPGSDSTPPSPPQGLRVVP